MNQFDQKTEIKAKEQSKGKAFQSTIENYFIEGRFSARTSIRIMALALSKIRDLEHSEECSHSKLCICYVGTADEAIDAAKDNGDWPLEEPPPPASGLDEKGES
ncbi:MAG: hypothetical protein ACXWQO_19670 [Bdellovibrionota bacterium]